MHAIMSLLDQMKSEKNDSYSYAKCAIMYKSTDPTLADMYIALARAEMEHYSKLYAQVDRILSDRPIEENTKEMHAWLKANTAEELNCMKQMIESYR